MKNFTFILLVCIAIEINAQQVAWQELAKMNSSSAPTCNTIFCNGYIYFIGSAMGMEGTIFNSTGANPDTITEYGTFLAKYNTNGALIWVKRIGTNTFLYNLKTKDGYIYASMYYSGTAEFFGTSYTNTTSYGEDIILMKMNQEGNPVWVKKIGGQNNDRVFDIFIDNSSNILMTGWFNSTILFDTIQLNTNSTSNFDVFIAKFDSAGNAQWAQKFGGTGSDEGYGIAADASNNIVITGSFKNSITNTAGTINSLGSTDVFIAKFDPNGTILWMKSAGGINNDCGREIKFDLTGNIVVAGFFYQSATFGSLTATANYQTDVFLAKYTTAGTEQWIKSGGGDLTFIEEPTSILFDNNNNIYLTGNFCGSAHFGSLSSSSYSNTRMFLIKYSSTGSEMWLNAGSNTTNITSFGSTMDTNKGIYVSGQTLQGTNIYNAFLLKVNDNTLTKAETNEFSGSNFLIYPNPGKGQITIEAERLETISLYHITGRLLKIINTESDKVTINTSEFIPGVYIIMLQTGKGNYCNKILLE
ncbi:MAG: hypothetical protein A2275_05660 [Bacteroidetes bacterium RIFOXYA12_FULL_35_11]|nr:MAG: hypothetical protein A2X01_10820 [Bacteroidetes bacterium GWF2_35_48]OFY74968.1 MAG: hypothetical protein A2275_05660 [Bacteroidetes bacterium RIFOXYA12_FULL_35_11]OFY92680.1 MAG: hypothetical protein A2491_02160 [Bacteroidetes bacterium RIFOXYC12_FULL_35_7]HBX53204.1 hypothetical protein [Bacteroidales bacterium]